MEWERQPGESARAYEAARAYFELGPGRTVAMAAAHVGKSHSVLKRWAVKWRWVERAAAYDEHLHAIGDQARERAFSQAAEAQASIWAERLQQARESQWVLSQELLAKAREMLEEDLANTRWSLRDVAIFIDLATKLMRAAVGKDEDDSPDALTPDLHALIEKVYGKENSEF